MTASRFLKSDWLAAAVAIGFLIGCSFLITGCSKEQTDKKDSSKTTTETKTAMESTVEKKTASPFQDEPAAHALYNQMIEAMRKADSLSYVSRYEIVGKARQECIYRVWLKKPNYFRVETENVDGRKRGILIGDGNDLWIYWPEGRPKWSWEPDVESDADKKVRLTSYMTDPAPPGGHSIGHSTTKTGSGAMPILDPSTFHGYTDSLQGYLDGVKSLESERIGDEDCDKIELSIMQNQRSWWLWLSKRDHLPRKLKQIVQVSYDLVMNEDWSSVTLNADMPGSMFSWKPPEGWTQWKFPTNEESLLKPGVKAPEFELSLTDGKPVKMSDFRGQVVWFYMWRAG